MPKSTVYASDLLKLIFNATPIPYLADNAVSSPITVLYVALHTNLPAVGATQDTFEMSYPSYTRIAVPRTTSGWVVTGNSVSPFTPILFPMFDTATPVNLTHFSVGLGSSGATQILYAGTVSPTQLLALNTVPRLTTATAIIET